MQPTKLSLENFLSYGKEEISFDVINLASLTGHNGAGKSSLLEALTWGLYGAGRYRDIDRYVRQGQEQATVELQFSLNGETYRIVRGRNLKGRGKSTLELFRLNGGEWVSISGATIRETEQRIRDLLRMDYETFVSSCFILQGQSDRFCAAGPAERKKVLAQILGLDLYDKLQEAAKTKIKEQKEKTAVIRAKIESLEIELAGRAEIRSREGTLRDVLQEVKQQIYDMHMDLEELEKKKAELQIKAGKLGDLKERKALLEEEIRQIDIFLQSVAEKEKDAGRSVKLEQQLENISAEIKSLEAEVETAEKKLAGWQIQASKHQDLQNTLTRLEKEIHQYREQLKTLEEKRNRYQQIVERKDQIKNKAVELDQVKNELAELERKSIQERELLQRLNAAEKALAEWKNQNERQILQLKSQRKEAEKKKAILEQVDCERRDCLFLKDAFEASELFEHCSNEIAKLEALKPPEALQNAYLEASDLLRTLAYDPVKHQGLRAKMQDLEKWAKLLPELDQAESSLNEIELQGRKLQEALEEKQRQKFQTEIELSKAENARIQVTDYESAVRHTKQKISRRREQEQEIRTELGRAHAAEEQLRELRKQAGTKRQERNEKEKQIRSLLLEIEEITLLSTKIEPLEREISFTKARLAEAREEEQSCRVELGKLEQRLADLEQKEQEKKALSLDLQEASREQYLYEQLVKAFGRNGIPALIVENALPDIENEANDLLGRLTGGRMSVQLLTQRDTKTGGVAETLDILIADEMGERPYEGWSGAERFEIDISLRLAISKFLARRAGTKIETLVIDEGASCLDYEGRQKFLEAIKAISEDFSKIIVVSHIDELKEAFPQQIHVYKTPWGSRVEVLA